MASSSEVLSVVVQITGAIDSNLGKSVDSVGNSLSSIDTKSAVTKAAVVAGVAAVGAAAVKAGQYLLDLGNEFDEAYDTIRIGTGATGEALEDLEQSFKDVYSSVPTDMESASTAISDYNTRLGLTGDELENISIQAIQVSDMLGEDLSSVIEETSQAFTAWDIASEDMGDAMDYLYKVSQSTGVGFTELASSVQSFAPQLQEMGYSFEEATALIGQLDKAGVNSSEVLSAMKKSVSSLAEEGYSASEGFEVYSEKIKNAKDMTEATTIASEIFGTKAASTMASAIRDGTVDVEAFAAELESSSESINGCAEDTYDYGEQLQLLKQQLQVALEPMATQMLNIANQVIPYLQAAFGVIAPAIQEVSDAVTPIMQSMFDIIVGIFEGLAPIFQTVFSSIGQIISALMPIVQEVFDVLSPIIQTVISLISSLGVLLFEQIIPPITQIITLITNVVTMILGQLSPVLSTIAGVLTGIFGVALSSVINLVGSLLSGIGSVITYLSGTFSPMWSSIWGTVSSVFTSIVSGLASAFKTPINTIISGINTFINGINKIKIPSWVPGVGGKGFSISTLSYLEHGGFVKGDTIAGENGLEAIINLDSNKGEAIETWVYAGEKLGQIGSSNSNVIYNQNYYQGNEHSGFVNKPTYLNGNDVVISFKESVRNSNIKYWEQAGKQLGVIDSSSNVNLPLYENGGVINDIAIAGEAGKEAIINLEGNKEDAVNTWICAGVELGQLNENLMSNNLNNTYKSFDDSGFVNKPTYLNGNDVVISFKESVRNSNIKYWEQAGQQLGIFDPNSKALNYSMFEDGRIVSETSNVLSNVTGSIISSDDGYTIIINWDFDYEPLPTVKEDNSSNQYYYDFSGIVYSPTINYDSNQLSEEDKEKIKEILKQDKEEFYDYIMELKEEMETDSYD